MNFNNLRKSWIEACGAPPERGLSATQRLAVLWGVAIIATFLSFVFHRDVPGERSSAPADTWKADDRNTLHVRREDCGLRTDGADE